MAITIRPVQDDDWPALWPLLHEMGKTDTEARVRERVRQVSCRDDHFLTVALHGSSVAGYVWAQDYGAHIRSGQSTVRMHDLFVAPSYRRHGVGARLLGAVKAWATERGATWLEWQSGQAALPFYGRLGLTGDPCPDPEHPFFEIDLTTTPSIPSSGST